MSDKPKSTGINGNPPASEILRKPFHRISFCHAELAGFQMWFEAANEGIRAANIALAAP